MTTFYTPAASVPNDIESRDGYLSMAALYEKGLQLPPLTLAHDTTSGSVKVYFEKTPLASCQCQIECRTEGTATTIGPLCPEEEEHEVTFENQTFLSDRPTILDFQFEDGSGNITSFEVASLVGVVPATPLVAHLTDMGHERIEVGVPVTSSAMVGLPEATQYQIQRYIRNQENAQVWVDWRDITAMPSTHWDMPVHLDVQYGYRVRFRSTFDHSSKWSTWATMTPGS